MISRVNGVVSSGNSSFDTRDRVRVPAEAACTGGAADNKKFAALLEQEIYNQHVNPVRNSKARW